MSAVRKSLNPSSRVIDAEGDMWECFDSSPDRPDAKYTMIVVGDNMLRLDLERKHGPLREVPAR